MLKLSPSRLAQISKIVGARRVQVSEQVQSLWGGYGELLRVECMDAPMAQVIVKFVDPPQRRSTASNGEDARSHARKLRSYGVEQHWYQAYASRCNESCRVARCYGTLSEGSTKLFVFEDLDAAGYPRRVSSARMAEVFAVLRWLAAFHATFLGVAPDGLWKNGTYWHLATRPDELTRMRNDHLRKAAHEIDRRLNAGRYQTLVHGDAKVENFCFPHASEGDLGQAVAAVDFQYVGGGCGMKDVAYFLSSVFGTAECFKQAEACLQFYFAELRTSLARCDSPFDEQAVEAEWRMLYPVAWADLQRFLEGWAPGHYDDDSYAKRMIELALAPCGSTDHRQ